MEITLVPLTSDHREPVMDIFNYYIENSFAAYPEKKLPYEFFDTILTFCQDYPTAAATVEPDEVVGFGMLRPYNPIPTFSKTAEITYFIKTGYTGLGIGKTLLDYLVDEGRKMGLTTILASISSLNERSINFHLKNGFVKCGRLKNVGLKQGKSFDVVYCQRML